jgi:hypothetical protein
MAYRCRWFGTALSCDYETPTPKCIPAYREFREHMRTQHSQAFRTIAWMDDSEFWNRWWRNEWKHERRRELREEGW